MRQDCHKILRFFFKKNELTTALDLINDIEMSKLPTGFDPVKHTSDALGQTLYPYGEITKIKRSHLEELKRVKDKLAKCEKKLSKTEQDRRALKSGKRRRDSDAPKAPTYDKINHPYSAMLNKPY